MTGSAATYVHTVEIDLGAFSDTYASQAGMTHPTKKIKPQIPKKVPAGSTLRKKDARLIVESLTWRTVLAH